MKLKLNKVYTVSKKGKPEKPRLFMQHLVCETAGFQKENEIYIKVDESNEEIQLQNFPFEEETEYYTVHVSARQSKISGKDRPLIDTAGDKFSFLDINQKIEVNVFREGSRGKVVIRPLEYRLFENTTIPTPKDERIKVLSVCAGAGVGTSVLTDTGYFSAVQEIEWEDDSVEVLLRNFPNSTVFAGDLRDCQNVSEVELAFITMPCSEHSTLGFQEGNVMNELAIAAAKIVKSSKAQVLFFENVPQFYKSQSWFTLKNLLEDEYPFWAQKELEAWDFGSLATRKRTYAVAFKNEDRFLAFDFPKAPKLRRKKLKDFMDHANVQHEWKSIAKFMESFNSREAWRDRSLELTFVDKNAERIQCIPKRYSSQCASNSYVKSEDGDSFRFLSINEIKKILAIPDWFDFTEHTQKIRKYEMLGQSVSGQVIRAIANRIAYCFMKVKQSVVDKVEKVKHSYTIADSGQLELAI